MQFIMIAAGAKADTFTWGIRSLKFWFRLNSSGLWGMRVNLLLVERGLPYMYIIILICMSVEGAVFILEACFRGCQHLFILASKGGSGRPWTHWSLKFEKCFPFSFELVK